MADLLQSQVTVLRSWTEGGVTGKERKGALVTLNGTWTCGSTANKLLASAMGFTKIESCSNGVLDDNSLVYLLSPAADGTYLVLTQVQAATGIPVDVTVTTPRTLAVEVHGYF